MAWDAAWAIVTRTFAYTNHTLLPEALENWSVPLFQHVLPRHLQIIFEINKRLLEAGRGEVARRRREEARAARSSRKNGRKMVRMAQSRRRRLPCGQWRRRAAHRSCSRSDLFPEFDALYPGKFNNKTNGITPRRWLLDVQSAPERR